MSLVLDMFHLLKKEEEAKNFTERTPGMKKKTQEKKRYLLTLGAQR